MQVIWSPASLRQIQHIHDYIARDNPGAAIEMAEVLFEAGRSLDVFPHRGRPVPGTKMRELIVRPYIVRYQVDGNRVLIVRVRHGARRPTNP
jgi:addiction module RelE/StbE family toxin